MNNFKSATLLAAVSLPAFSFGAALPAIAQTAGSSGAQNITVAQFDARYDIPVTEVATPIISSPVASTPPTERLSALETLASGKGLAWQKVYDITPATAAEPVTTLAQARQMIDNPSRIDLNATSLPESAAFKIIASADNAKVKYAGEVEGSRSPVALAGTDVAQAIASLASQTGTHWQAVYVLAPAASAPSEPIRIADASYAPRNRRTDYLPTTEGPFIIHVADPPAQSAANNTQLRPGPVPSGSATPPSQSVSAIPGQPIAANPPALVVGNNVIATPYSSYGNVSQPIVGGDGSVVSQ